MATSYCITGGGGYLGYHIGKQLRSAGHRVVLFDRARPDPIWTDDEDEDVLGGFEFVEGDICDVQQLKDAFRGVDCVIHTASYGMSGREQLQTFWNKTEEVNIGGTRNIIEACCYQNVQGLVYTSTYNVVFGGQEIQNGDESLPYFPLHQHSDHYSRTKSIAEQIVLSVDGKRLRGGGVLRTCSLRMAGIMGPKEQRHIPRIMEYVQKGFVRFKYGLQDAMVDFVSIHNAVAAHVLAADAVLKPSRRDVVGGQAYFISDGEPIGNFDYFGCIIEGVGYSAPKRRIPVSFVFALAFVLEWIPTFVRVRLDLTTILTKAEVYKTAVTHNFSIEKAQSHLKYHPTKPNDVSEIVEWLCKTGYSRNPSSLPHQHQVRHISCIRNLIQGVLLVCVLFIVFLVDF